MFCNLDRVVLLAKGSVYYDGPPRDTVQYFERLGYAVPEGVNPADHFISIAENADRDEAGSASIQALIDAWKKRKEQVRGEKVLGKDGANDEGVVEKQKNSWPTPWVAELAVLLQRATRDQVSLGSAAFAHM